MLFSGPSETNCTNKYLICLKFKSLTPQNGFMRTLKIKLVNFRLVHINCSSLDLPKAQVAFGIVHPARKSN